MVHSHSQHLISMVQSLDHDSLHQLNLAPDFQVNFGNCLSKVCANGGKCINSMQFFSISIDQEFCHCNSKITGAFGDFCDNIIYHSRQNGGAASFNSNYDWYDLTTLNQFKYFLIRQWPLILCAGMTIFMISWWGGYYFAFSMHRKNHKKNFDSSSTDDAMKLVRSTSKNSNLGRQQQQIIIKPKIVYTKSSVSEDSSTTKLEVNKPIGKSSSLRLSALNSTFRPNLKKTKRIDLKYASQDSIDSALLEAESDQEIFDILNESPLKRPKIKIPSGTEHSNSKCSTSSTNLTQITPRIENEQSMRKTPAKKSGLNYTMSLKSKKDLHLLKCHGTSNPNSTKNMSCQNKNQDENFSSSKKYKNKSTLDLSSAVCNATNSVLFPEISALKTNNFKTSNVKDRDYYEKYRNSFLFRSEANSANSLKSLGSASANLRNKGVINFGK